MRFHTLMIPAAALALAAFVRPADELRFSPTEKATLKKVYTTSMKTESTDFKMVSDGQDVPLDDIGKPVFKTEETAAINVTDEYTKVEKGRPLELKRTFDKLTGKRSQTMGGDEEDTDGESKERTSKLEGKSVLFTWDPKKEEYKKSFAGEGGDKDLLEHVEEDMDFRAFLPDEKPAKDATWDIEPKAFGVVLAPGGDLQLRGEGDEEDNGKMDAELETNLGGKAKATYKGSREVDGKKVAVIAIKATLETHGEQEDKSGEGNSRMEMKIGFELEGELLWDTAAGHMFHFELGGPVRVSIKMTEDADVEGTHHTGRTEIEFKGDTKFEAKLDT